MFITLAARAYLKSEFAGRVVLVNAVFLENALEATRQLHFLYIISLGSFLGRRENENYQAERAKWKSSARVLEAAPT